MSHQSNVGSFTDKQKLEEDKLELYGSSRTDSGFISGEINSEELTYSGPIFEEKKKVGPAQSHLQAITDSGVIEEEDDSIQGVSKNLASMLVDSGVCLSENFSKLSVSQGFNDLDVAKKEQLVDSSVSLSEHSNKYLPPVQVGDFPWKIYYEQNEDGDTHLHLSIVSGFTDLTLALIRSAPFPYLLDIVNDDGNSPLHLAVATGQWHVVRWLIVAGANPCPRNGNGESPLHLAAKSNDHMCVKAIANPVRQEEKAQMTLKYQGQVYRQCNFDQWNFTGQTCVHVAALYGNIEVLRHLIWYGANINAREGCGGYTALHYAVERGDQALVEFLAQCEQIDLDALNYRGRTALEVSRMVPSHLVQLLTDRGMSAPYFSDEEDLDDDDDEVMYEPPLFNVPLVNASA